MDNAALVDKMRKQANTVYLATEQSVAADLSNSLQQAAAEIVRLVESECKLGDVSGELELTRQTRDQALSRLHDSELIRRKLLQERQDIELGVEQIGEALGLKQPYPSTSEVAEYARTICCRLGSLQATIDSLMLEFCPDRMSPEQLAEWEKHQVTVEPRSVAEKQELE